MVDAREPVGPLGSFLFLSIFRSFRMAIQPSKLALAFAAVTVITLAGGVMDLNRTVVATDDFTYVPDGEAVTITRPGWWITELDIYLTSDTSVADFRESNWPQGRRVGVCRAFWTVVAEQFHAALYALFALDIWLVIDSIANCIRAVLWAFHYHTVYSIIFFTIVFVMVSLAGGAICRIAALQFARGERSGFAQGLRFAIRKSLSLFAAPITPVAIILLFGACIALLGLVGSIPVVGELLTGLLLPLSLIAAALMAVLVVGLIGGLNLMAPSVAYEDSDSFTAIAHSFSYVYNKPWHIGFYTVVAAVYGAVCYLFTRFFAFLLLWLTYQFLQVGSLRNEKLAMMWPEPVFDDFLRPAATMPDTWPFWLGALLTRLWVLAVVGLLVSFIISFYFCANTVIYALMRYRVDSTPMDEVYAGPEESTPEPPLSETPSEADSGAPAVSPEDQRAQDRQTSE